MYRKFVVVVDDDDDDMCSYMFEVGTHLCVSLNCKPVGDTLFSQT
jgi:hypothetical protein